MLVCRIECLSWHDRHSTGASEPSASCHGSPEEDAVKFCAHISPLPPDPVAETIGSPLPARSTVITTCSPLPARSTVITTYSPLPARSTVVTTCSPLPPDLR
jgi:hypothetical protein